MRILIGALLSVLLITSEAWGQGIDVSRILQRLDQNLYLERARLEAELVVNQSNKSHHYRLEIFIQGPDTALVVFKAPATARGRKWLKLGSRLWLYFPEPVDRIITVAGHMLRRNVLGSDMTYSDLTANPKLGRDYRATVVAQDTLKGRPCWVLELTARRRGLSYPRRKVWVDQERFLPLREERFGKSGRLLERIQITKVEKIDQRWWPTELVIKNTLVKGKGTWYRVHSLELNPSWPDYIFSKQGLRSNKF